MVDTTNPVPSASVPLVDRFRLINPVWLRWFKPLLETARTTAVAVTTVRTEVDGLTATVTETAESVDAMGGSWGVAIDINGKVIGRVKLDGSVTESEFNVLADKFIVSHPTSTDEMQVFVIGMVNGVSTVGINGDLVVDESISADKLDVNELTAISADFGTATVSGAITSANGKVELNFDTGRFRWIA